MKTVAKAELTVVDGFKVAEDLKKENPQDFNILVNTLINYKFEDNDAILEKTGKIIKLSARRTQTNKI